MYLYCCHVLVSGVKDSGLADSKMPANLPMVSSEMHFREEKTNKQCFNCFMNFVVANVKEHCSLSKHELMNAILLYTMPLSEHLGTDTY